MNTTSIAPLIALTLIGSALAQPTPPAAAGHSAGEAIHTPSQIMWRDGPPSLPPGAKFAILEGDPAKEGPFTMRIRMPDGFKIPPHTHPKVEHGTVISGMFNFGMGATFDQAATQAMPAGTFGHWPAGMKHFAWAKGETVIQVHGIGPWKIEYLNPADDPRNRQPANKP